MDGQKTYLVFLLLPVALFILILSLPATHGATISCSVSSLCGGAVLLNLENTSGGYENAHAELTNYSGAYQHTLCCTSDENHTLSSDCTNASTIPVLLLSNETNAHVQIPSLGTYAHPACLGATYGDITCEYVNDTCSEGFDNITSMASSEGDNITNAHIGEFDTYRLKVCCRFSNSPPDTPTLLYPVNGNISVFERTPTLQWTTFEPDGDTVTYNLSLNVTPGSCAVEHQESALSQDNFTTNELCTDQSYNWSVQACDVDGCSAWANVFNFTIESIISLTLLSNSTDFGSLAPLASTDTESGDANPMRVENDGNIYLDITLNATQSLFDQVTLNNTAFRYRGAANESSSFTTSQSTYTNVTATHTTVFGNLSYIDVNDDGLIHYNVTVPFDEAPGEKNTTIIVRATAT